MKLFGLGSKQESSSNQRPTSRPMSQKSHKADTNTGKKLRPSQEANDVPGSTINIAGSSHNTKSFSPLPKIPGDGAFLNSMGEVNQPAAVYQQHLAREWQRKAAARAEARVEHSSDEQIMLAPQRELAGSRPIGKQWPMMPIQFIIDHDDLHNPRYHTMFLHLGLDAAFFRGCVSVYNRILDKYCMENNTKTERLKLADCRAIGERAAYCITHQTSGRFDRLVRVDYSFSDIQRDGKFILTYPLHPEDIIPWCETHKLPFLSDRGIQDWELHKAELQASTT